jgi:hypothetical protein
LASGRHLVCVRDALSEQLRRVVRLVVRHRVVRTPLA